MKFGNETKHIGVGANWMFRGQVVPLVVENYSKAAQRIFHFRKLNQVFIIYIIAYMWLFTDIIILLPYINSTVEKKTHTHILR